MNANERRFVTRESHVSAIIFALCPCTFVVKFLKYFCKLLFAPIILRSSSMRTSISVREGGRITYRNSRHRGAETGFIGFLHKNAAPAIPVQPISMKIPRRRPPRLAPSRRCDSRMGRGLGSHEFSLQDPHISTVAAHGR